MRELTVHIRASVLHANADREMAGYGLSLAGE